MKKSKFLFKILLFLNLFFIVIQQLLLESSSLGLELPLLILFIPILCLINLFFFSFWFFRFKWPALISFLFFLANLSSWQLIYQIKPNAISISEGLKVMSFNVRAFNRFKWLDRKKVPESIEKFIQKKSPDIICFQEYDNKLSPNFDEYKFKIFKPYKNNGRVGSCIVSKYPLINGKEILFENSLNGGMQSDLIWKRDTLRIYNIHFESLKINSNDTIFSSEYSKKIINKLRKVFTLQRNQMSKFLELIHKNKLPEIICTDLNNNSFSDIYNFISKGRNDAFLEKGSGFGSTYRFPFFPLRIDYIFTSKNIKVLDFKTYDIDLSDHKPILAKLQWP